MKPHGDASRRVPIDGRQIECRTIGEAGPSSPVLVFLHEGLGSVSMWRGFPDRLCAEVGLPGLVYSRPGHGSSDPTTGLYSPGFMHDEATGTLPAVLRAFDIRQPVLFGHSDGASIALIHAGAAGRPVAGLALMAPHVIVEDLSVASIEAAKVAWRTTDLRARLARHHDDVDRAFTGWNDIWLHPDFRAWNIEDEVRGVRCPVLAIQGEDDEYGTMEQVERIARLVPDTELVRLADCRHSPHRDQPQAVLDALVAFVDRLP